MQMTDATLQALVYRELKQLARRALKPFAMHETLNTTALAHEAYVKLAQHAARHAMAPEHLRALVARTMRQLLVDRARRRFSEKHGATALAPPSSLDQGDLQFDGQPIDIVLVDDLLVQLAALDRRQAEIVEQHVFGGMSFADIAKLHQLTERTIFRDWRKARAFLIARLDGLASP